MAWPFPPQGEGGSVTEGSNEGAKVKIRLMSKKVEPELKIAKVELLGYDEQIKWTRDNDGLKVQLPLTSPCDFAFSLKIELRDH